MKVFCSLSCLLVFSLNAKMSFISFVIFGSIFKYFSLAYVFLFTGQSFQRPHWNTKIFFFAWLPFVSKEKPLPTEVRAVKATFGLQIPDAKEISKTWRDELKEKETTFVGEFTHPLFISWKRCLIWSCESTVLWLMLHRYSDFSS